MTKEERADILNHWSVGPLGEFGEWEEQRSQISLDLCRSELKLEDCRAGRDVNLRVTTHWLRYLVAPPSHAPSFLLLLPTRHPNPNDPSASSPVLLSRVRWESERGGSNLPVIKYSEFSASSYLGNGELILCAYTPPLQFQFWESNLSVQGGLKSRVLPDKPKGEE